MERLGSSLQLAGLTSDALEQETGIKERRMWPTGTTVVQVGQLVVGDMTTCERLGSLMQGWAGFQTQY